MNKGEIWFLELPFKDGREQRGYRPAIVLADTTVGMMVVTPLTSNLQALRFPHTLEIKKSKENGLNADSVALVFQIQSLDKQRFKNKMGVLEAHSLRKVDELLRKLLAL